MSNRDIYEQLQADRELVIQSASRAFQLQLGTPITPKKEPAVPVQVDIPESPPKQSRLKWLFAFAVALVKELVK